MKKLLCVILSLVFILSLCACGQKNKVDDNASLPPTVNPEKVETDIPARPENVDSEELTLVEKYNIETLQGKIDNYYTSHTYTMLKVDNFLYEYDSADDFEREDCYLIYDISNYNSVVYYKANGIDKDSVVVLDDKNNNLTAIVATKRDTSKHTAQFNTIELKNIKADEIVECESSEKNNVLTLVYKQDDQIKYLIKYLDGKEFMSGNIEDLISDEDESYKLSDFLYENKDYVYALNDNKDIRTFELRCWKRDDGNYWTECIINDENLSAFKGWNRFVLLNILGRTIVCQDDKPDTLKAYVRGGDWQNPTYSVVDNIKLPGNYKGTDIDTTYELLNQIVIRFTDGEYYLLHCAFGEKEMMAPLAWTKLAGLTKISKEHKLDKYGPDLCALSSDGKLYSYSFLF